MSSAGRPFGDCKNAMLHRIEEVQSYGVFVAVDVQSQVIEYCSANSAMLLDAAPGELLGRSALDSLPVRWPDLARLAAGEGSPEWRSFEGERALSVTGHRRGSHLLLEFEPFEPTGPHWWNCSERRRYLEALIRTRSIDQCRKFLVDTVFEYSGFDRVMMYQFLPDWTGEVVCERCRPGVQGFAGLRFPASDIPPNARQLFTLNWQRAIVDVDCVPSPILRDSPDSRPLDLTWSMLRSAHPVHIQYLKNMGVQASQTISVVINGKLWALIACHHLGTRALPMPDRLALEEMSRLASMHLTTLVSLVEAQSKAEMRTYLSQLQTSMAASGDDARNGLARNLILIRQMFAAGGAWLRYEGDDVFSGVVPDPMSLRPLRDFVEGFARDQVSWYDSLPAALQPWRALAANASGMLFLPLGSGDFIALFRPEMVQTVNWAGKPYPEGESPAEWLSPRSSFAAWSQNVRYTAEQWSDIQREFAAILRGELRQFIANAKLEQIAMRDALTQLANRLLFERRLHQEVRTAMTRNTAFTVYMIDLDRFKQVNDTYGHAAGDALLKQVATRLRSIVLADDTVARLGGDEFAILQPGVDSKTIAGRVAQEIVRTISEPYRIGEALLEISASVGVSICPSDTVKEEELMEHADRAMYQVKRSGRRAYSVYEPGMEETETAPDNLLHALHSGEFKLVYQPVIDARSGRLRGLETFLRWHKPGGTLVPARDFISSITDRRLQPEFSEWVMDAVFRQYQHWVRSGMATVPVTVNISQAEFESVDLIRLVAKMADRYETGRHWLRLDIREQALSPNPERAAQLLKDLQDAGIGVNLDQFGSGVIPLRYLTRVQFFTIKLDAILLQQKKDRSRLNAFFRIVQAITEVCTAQLTITRVDTPQLWQTLRDQRIDLLQGYAFAHPADGDSASAWLSNPDRIFDLDARADQRWEDGQLTGSAQLHQ